MRTNRNGVTENAEYNIDREKFEKNHEEIFGEKPKQFCEKCDNRIAYCECPKEELKPKDEK